VQPVHVIGGAQAEEFMMERTESAHSVVKDDFEPKSESRLWESERGDICFPSWSSTVGIMIVLILLLILTVHCRTCILGEKRVVRTTLRLDKL